jgi:hypothetical protein
VLLAVGPVVSLAADPALPVQRTLVISVGRTVPLQMASKKPIVLVVNEKESVARVAPSGNDPTTILITGLAPGVTRITLTDIDGRKEAHNFGGP